MLKSLVCSTDLGYVRSSSVGGGQRGSLTGGQQGRQGGQTSWCTTRWMDGLSGQHMDESSLDCRPLPAPLGSMQIRTPSPSSERASSSSLSTGRGPRASLRWFSLSPCTLLSLDLLIHLLKRKTEQGDYTWFTESMSNIWEEEEPSLHCKKYVHLTWINFIIDQLHLILCDTYTVVQIGNYCYLRVSNSFHLN